MSQHLYDPLTWLVGGEAGYGITTMGQMFARACCRAGLEVFGYAEYPSLIRGGHNTAMVRVHEQPVLAHSDKVDLMLALNKETIDLHLDEMAEGGVIIYDGESVEWEGAKGIQAVSVPLARLVKELEGQRIMRNTVGFGASFALAGLPFEYIASVLETTFSRKGQEVVDFNVKMAKAGYDYVSSGEGAGKVSLSKQLKANPERGRKMMLSGNEAHALGGIKAGMKFMAAYPMTPATSIMLNVAKHGVKHNIIMKHTEDEIAAMNMVIGAAWMGVRAMTATSGGGFALMGEALGMAGITECPIVAIESCRPGPSTGLPTWTDQGDLRFVMHASQGEFPRIMMLPGDVEESFYMTLKAFNLAERYQMPVLINSDKYLGESIQSIAPLEHKDYKVDRGELMSVEEAMKLEDGSYKRYEFTETGISKRALPGYPNCIHTVSTDEHKEDGDLDESAENRKKMVDKRAQKMETLKQNELPESELYALHGPEEAELTVVGWGSTMGPILEAVKVAGAEGLKVNFLRIKYVFPFATESVAKILKEAKNVLLVENNAHAQMGGVIAENTGFLIQNKKLRYDGRPLCPAEILDSIREHYSKPQTA